MYSPNSQTFTERFNELTSTTQGKGIFLLSVLCAFALGGGAAVLAIEFGDNDTSKNDDGAFVARSNEMSAQGGGEAGRATANVFEAYAKALQEHDPLTIGLTIAIGIAILAIVAKLLWAKTSASSNTVSYQSPLGAGRDRSSSVNTKPDDFQALKK